MNEQDRHALFSKLITRDQSALYGYIFAVVRRWEDADDLFQSICLVLWRKFGQFQPNSDFFSWARQTAKLEVSNFLRRRRLPNSISEELLDALTDAVVVPKSDMRELYLSALQRCRQKLAAADEGLLELHYVENLGSRQIADQLKRSQSSVCHSLRRIHGWLSECIRTEMAQQEHSARERS
jgi:RNA polymerase sigma-70 factor, ECF subfamily